MSEVDELAAWLTRIWDEQENIALYTAGWDRSGRKRASGQWVRTGISSLEDDERRSIIYSDSGQVSEAVADHIARHDPATVLARIAADRAILAECSIVLENKDPKRLGERILAWAVVRQLASVHRDRPNWREAWQ